MPSPNVARSPATQSARCWHDPHHPHTARLPLGRAGPASGHCCPCFRYRQQRLPQARPSPNHPYPSRIVRPASEISANEGYPTDSRNFLCGPVIITRYLGPTNHRCSRVKATHKRDSEVTWQATMPWDHALNSEANHLAVANKLLANWITSSDLIIVGRGHDHEAYYWLVVGRYQLEG